MREFWIRNKFWPFEDFFFYTYKKESLKIAPIFKQWNKNF